MQNYVVSRQIDRNGYHSIGNSRFSGKNVTISLAKNVHVKIYGGSKFWWDYFGGLGFTKTA